MTLRLRGRSAPLPWGAWRPQVDRRETLLDAVAVGVAVQDPALCERNGEAVRQWRSQAVSPEMGGSSI